MNMYRIGYGEDTHLLQSGRALIIGGITIPYELGLLGHSDADVLMHAIADALLGAAGLPDIGRVFPDTDPKYKDANSGLLLAEVARMVRQKGFTIGNVDATVIAQAPKLAPHIDNMRATIAGFLAVQTEFVNVKATTTEGVGPEGRGECISARAVALIYGMQNFAGFVMM